MKRPLPDLLESALVEELLRHHCEHFGVVSLQEPEAEGVPIHIGRRNVARLVSDSKGPEVEALGLAIDALLKQQEAGADTENTTDTPAADTGSDENKEG